MDEDKKTDFSAIEKKWQKRWEDSKVFEVKEDAKKKKYYVLEMYPYPSASGLHIGHAFNYTIGDIIARFKKMQGLNVLHPMGYDSFGLPAENAAIKESSHPKIFTEKAIENYIRQQKALGLSYDWTRKIQSHDIKYYKWNQYLFLQLMKKGLVYRKKSPVNWCPKCNSVLANEQVHEGKCWVHKDINIEIKPLEQWFIKTTEYAEELLNMVDKLDWPDRIKAMQKNWIGKSHGIEINFEINEEKWPIFTTRPDTIYGVTFIVVSAQHPRLMELVAEKQKKEVAAFLKKIKSTSEKDTTELEKDGVFTGSYAINPINREKVPVWAGNFVVADYGCGMVMAVPAHDQRDFEFAKKYKIPIKEVIKPNTYDLNSEKMNRAFISEGILVNSNKFNGMISKEAIEEISSYLEKSKIGKRVVNYKLRDWLVSRQRYWGTPIPVVYCDSCKDSIEKNAISLSFYEQEHFNNLVNGSKKIETRALNPDEKNRDFAKIKTGDTLKCVNKADGNVIYLNVVSMKIYKNLRELFEDKEALFKIFPKRKIESINDLESLYSYTLDYLKRIEENGLVAWNVKLIIPGIVPILEKDLPVLLPEDVKFGEGNPLNTSKKFVETKCPKCKNKARRETDTMDTFFDSSWYYLRFCDANNLKEPFDKKKIEYWMPVDFYTGGAEHACMHLIYARFFTKALRDLGFLKFDEPFTKLFNQGMVHGEDGVVMSKSRGNVVDPLDIAKKYSADALRLFLVSLASPDKDSSWSVNGFEGSWKFTNKVYKFGLNAKFKKSSEKLEHKINKNIKEITESIENLKYNIAVIKLREIFEGFEEGVSKEDFIKFLKMFSVFCPHLAEEILEKIGGKGFISTAEWPKADESKINNKLEEEEKAVDKAILDILNVLKIIKEKQGKEVNKVYLYVLPNEIENYNKDILGKKVGKEVFVFAVNDKKKYDPSGKAGKAKPGKPGIYVE
ncbi:MAG: leucine--tRNA ligase [Nanoarchaeota archaeon]